MSKGKEFIEKHKPEPLIIGVDDNRPLPAEWVEPFVLDVARKVGDELIISDRLKEHLEKNKAGRNVIFPKANIGIAGGKMGWWSKTNSVASTGGGNKMSMSKESPKSEVHLNFPNLGIDFSGPLTRDKITEDIVPLVKKALIDAGYSQEQAQEKVSKSIEALLKEKLPMTAVAKYLQNILHNINSEIKESVVDETKGSSGNIPVMSSDSVVETAPSKRTLKNLQWKKDNEERRLYEQKLRTLTVRQLADVEARYFQQPQTDDEIEYAPRKSVNLSAPDPKRTVQNPDEENSRTLNPAKISISEEKQVDQDKTGHQQDDGNTNMSADSESVSTPEVVENIPFEFDVNMLTTTEGRKAVFREIIKMYNTVRNQRDDLGIKTNKHFISNREFDGYYGVLADFILLKKRIRIYSERSESSNEGVIDLSQEEKNDFSQRFKKLQSFYQRTQNFVAEKSGTNVEPPPQSAQGEISAGENSTSVQMAEPAFPKSPHKPARWAPRASKTGLGAEPALDTLTEGQSEFIMPNILTKNGENLAGAHLKYTEELLKDLVDYYSTPRTLSSFEKNEPIRQVVQDILAVLAFKKYSPEQIQSIFSSQFEKLYEQITVADNLTALNNYENAKSIEKRQELFNAVFSALKTVTPEIQGHTTGIGTEAKENDLLVRDTPAENEQIDSSRSSKIRAETFRERSIFRGEWKEWRAKKLSYENELDAYAQAEKKRKEGLSRFSSFIDRWRKEKKPESLLKAEREYLESRKKYGTVLGEHFTKATLANHLVLRVVNQRNEIEKKYLTQKESGLLQSLQHTFSEHRSIVKKFGLVAVLATGSIFGLVRIGGSYLKDYLSANPAVAQSMLANYTSSGLATLSSISGAAFGGVVGTFIGSKLANAHVSYRGKQKTSAEHRSRRSFSTEAIERLENDYLARINNYGKAIKRKKTIIATGAVLGGIAGGVLGGNADEIGDVVEKAVSGDVSTKLPNATHVETILPPDPLPNYNPIDPMPDEPSSVTDEEVEALRNLDFVPPWEPEALVKDSAPPPPIVIEDAPADPPEPAKLEPVIEEITLPPSPQDGSEMPTFGSSQDGTDDVTEPEAKPGLVIEPEAKPPVAEEPEPAAEEMVEDPGVPELLYTFEPGSNFDTVSEAMENMWEENHDLVDESLTQTEFLRDMWATIAELESDPDLYGDMMEQMGITSGDIHEVKEGQTINLQPLFDYMNERNKS